MVKCFLKVRKCILFLISPLLCFRHEHIHVGLLDVCLMEETGDDLWKRFLVFGVRYNVPHSPLWADSRWQCCLQDPSLNLLLFHRSSLPFSMPVTPHSDITLFLHPQHLCIFNKHMCPPTPPCYPGRHHLFEPPNYKRLFRLHLFCFLFPIKAKILPSVCSLHEPNGCQSAPLLLFLPVITVISENLDGRNTGGR